MGRLAATQRILPQTWSSQNGKAAKSWGLHSSEGEQATCGQRTNWTNLTNVSIYLDTQINTPFSLSLSLLCSVCHLHFVVDYSTHINTVYAYIWFCFSVKKDENCNIIYEDLLDFLDRNQCPMPDVTPINIKVCIVVWTDRGYLHFCDDILVWSVVGVWTTTQGRNAHRLVYIQQVPRPGERVWKFTCRTRSETQTLILSIYMNFVLMCGKSTAFYYIYTVYNNIEIKTNVIKTVLGLISVNTA